MDIDVRIGLTGLGHPLRLDRCGGISMDIAASSLGPEAAYKLITGIVVPRPIAWVTTRAPEGHVNLAPFSAFTFVSTKPPMVGINVGRRKGMMKDTGRNIHATG